MGHGYTHIVPVYEGYAIPHSIVSIPFGGEALSRALFKGLNERPHFIANDDTFTFDLDVARTLKEAYCHVPYDFDNYLRLIGEGSIPKVRAYKLPETHREVLIPSEDLVWPAERYFSPISYRGKEVDGLQRLLIESVMRCDPDIRLQLFRNIVLSGGTSMMAGLKDRTRKEIQSACSSIVAPEVYAPADRKHSSWLGGSILSNISSFKHLWVTKEQWTQLGSAIIYRNCF
jgi:actin-related protein